MKIEMTVYTVYTGVQHLTCGFYTRWRVKDGIHVRSLIQYYKMSRKRGIKFFPTKLHFRDN